MPRNLETERRNYKAAGGWKSDVDDEESEAGEEDAE